MPDYRTLSPGQLAAWANDDTSIMRVRTDRDRLPGGYMAALAPMLVAWDRSSLNGGGNLLLRNINYGGNTLERTTVLQSLRVPLDGLEAAELILVPSNDLGEHDPVHHVQIRFLFDRDRYPELLHLVGEGSGSDARLYDLVLSWESWFDPAHSFSLKRGLDESSYGLTQRGFAGPQRYLEDAIRGREWLAYPLQMPGGQEGIRELFLLSCALGDGVARDTIQQLLERGRAAWVAQAPTGSGPGGLADVAEVWEDLFTRLRAAEAPSELSEGLPGGEQTYQVLVRSCAALSRYCILAAAHRAVGRGLTFSGDGEALPPPELQQAEPWMEAMSRTDLRGLFLHAPSAMRFLTRNPTALPGNIPRELFDAGLIQPDGDRPRCIRYGRRAVRPYSSEGLNNGQGA